MAVALTGTGGYFTRMGKEIDLVNKIVIHQNLLDTEIDDILDQFEDDREFAVELQNGLEGFKSAAGSPYSPLASVAETTLVEMVHADDPLPSKDVVTAFERLRDQMIDSSDTINGTTVSSSLAAGKEDGTSNVGNGTVVVSLVDALGNTTEYVRAEDILLECTNDAQENTSLSGRETFSVKGEVTVDRFNQAWPDGSGISSSTTAVDPAVNGGSSGSNQMTNSDFEDFTSDTPTGWTVEVGTETTDFRDTSTAHRGSLALEFIGDGATLTALQRSPTTALKPNTKYLLAAWVRDDGTPPAAGVMQISVRDTAGNIYNASTSLTTASKSIDLTAVGSIYAFQTIAFETATQLPTGAEVFIELTTALTAGRNAFIDSLVLIEMQQFGGDGGPFIAVLPGSTDAIREDLFTVTITNNNEGGFVRGLDRLLDLYPKALYFPSDTAGAETIPDSLIS